MNHTRDWSGELEESDFRLPFPIAPEDTKRGGNGRTIRFRDEIVLPRLDTLLAGQGFMIDMENMTSSGVDDQEVGGTIPADAERLRNAVDSLGIEIESLKDMSTPDSG